MNEQNDAKEKAWNEWASDLEFSALSRSDVKDGFDAGYKAGRESGLVVENADIGRDDCEQLPGVTFTRDDFSSPEDFLDFVSGDIGIDTDGVAKAFLLNETVESLGREGWHKSGIAALQQMARHWLQSHPHDQTADSEKSK